MLNNQQQDFITVRDYFDPLIPANTWDYFCLENVMYKDHKLTMLYDKSGKKYKRGKGLQVFVDGVLKGKSDKIEKLSVDL